MIVCSALERFVSAFVRTKRKKGEVLRKSTTWSNHSRVLVAVAVAEHHLLYQTGAVRSFDPKAHLAGEQIHNQQVCRSGPISDSRDRRTCAATFSPTIFKSWNAIEFENRVRGNLVSSAAGPQALVNNYRKTGRLAKGRTDFHKLLTGSQLANPQRDINNIIQ